LTDNGVECNGGLTCLAITNDKLTLTAPTGTMLSIALMLVCTGVFTL
jgi:hypothetical protein